MDEKRTTMSWKDLRKRTITREVNLSIPDIQKFLGEAGYIWLVIAANPHLSVDDIIEWAATQDVNALRSRTWITKRRWMFHPKFKPGGKRNPDGKDDRARRIMGEHPEISLRDLCKVLAENGIDRSREWVRRNRVSDTSSSIN